MHYKTAARSVLGVAFATIFSLIAVPSIAHADESQYKENSFRFTDGVPVSAIDTADKQSAADPDSFNAFAAVPNGDGFKVYDWFDRFSKGYCSGDGAAKVIDVSQWNESIDWRKVKNSGVDAVIIRCGYGSDYANQDDKYWKQNVQGALSVNMPIGVYLYSYADNTVKAQSEAVHTIRCLREAGLTPGKLALPVFYDIEDNKIASANLAATTQTYCEALRAAGYSAGVYSSTSWWDSKLTNPIFDRYTKWIAQWNTTIGLTAKCSKNFRTANQIWQFSDYGKVPGISGAVDLSYSYISSAYGVMAGPGTQTLENGTYEIVGYNQNYCLDVAGGSTAHGANMQIYSRNYTSAQKFNIRYDNAGFYTVTNVASNKLLDVSKGLNKAGVNVQQWGSNGNNAQKWRIDRNSDGTYTFISKCNNKSLDVDSACFRNRQNVRCWHTNGSLAQRWRVQRIDVAAGSKTVDNGVYTITSALNNKGGFAMDVLGGLSFNGTNVQIYQSNKTDAQRFRITYDGQGFYRIANDKTGKSLDVKTASTRNGANVQTYATNYTDAQKWRIDKNSDGTFTITSKCNRKVLDVTNGACKNYQNIQCWESNGSKAQKWTITPYVEKSSTSASE